MRLRQFLEKVEKPTGDLKDACWKGYTAVGMKMKNGKKVPNCVPVKESSESARSTARKLAETAAKRQLDELTKDTLKSYQKKALHDTISGKKDRSKGLTKALVKLSDVDKPILKKEETVIEQHREEGRFKPTVPKKVPNVSVGSPAVRRTDGARKADIVRSAAKKTAVVKDKFVPNPELSTTLTKNV